MRRIMGKTSQESLPAGENPAEMAFRRRKTAGICSAANKRIASG
jgi:hypothetical protein